MTFWQSLMHVTMHYVSFDKRKKVQIHHWTFIVVCRSDRCPFRFPGAKVCYESNFGSVRSERSGFRRTGPGRNPSYKCRSKTGKPLYNAQFNTYSKSVVKTGVIHRDHELEAQID